MISDHRREALLSLKTRTPPTINKDRSAPNRRAWFGKEPKLFVGVGIAVGSGVGVAVETGNVAVTSRVETSSDDVGAGKRAKGVMGGIESTSSKVVVVT